MSSSCLALSRRSAKEPHSAAPSHKTSAAGNRKADSLRVSPGKIVQAQGLLIQGHSRRSVSRSLHMSEHTVAKIVRTADFQKFSPGATRAAIRSRAGCAGIVPCCGKA
jgi:hypothetical protein